MATLASGAGLTLSLPIGAQWRSHALFASPALPGRTLSAAVRPVFFRGPPALFGCAESPMI